MRAKHLLESALLIAAIASGCSSSDNGPPVDIAMVTWTDNGVRHSVRSPHAAVVENPSQGPESRTFFILPIIDGQATVDLEVHTAHGFSTGDYHCGAGSDTADVKYGLAGERTPPSLQDCLVTVYRIGVDHGGIVFYTEGAFAGSIVIGTEQHDITDGTFSAPTTGAR
jgi:hypothetical protein